MVAKDIDIADTYGYTCGDCGGRSLGPKHCGHCGARLSSLYGEAAHAGDGAPFKSPAESSGRGPADLGHSRTAQNCPSCGRVTLGQRSAGELLCPFCASRLPEAAPYDPPERSAWAGDLRARALRTFECRSCGNIGNEHRDAAGYLTCFYCDEPMPEPSPSRSQPEPGRPRGLSGAALDEAVNRAQRQVDAVGSDYDRARHRMAALVSHFEIDTDGFGGAAALADAAYAALASPTRAFSAEARVEITEAAELLHRAAEAGDRARFERGELLAAKEAEVQRPGYVGRSIGDGERASGRSRGSGSSRVVAFSAGGQAEQTRGISVEDAARIVSGGES